MMKRFLAFLAALLCAGVARAEVEFDAVSSTAQANQSTLSWTHDVGDIESAVVLVAAMEAGSSDNLDETDVATVNSNACDPLHFSGTSDGWKLAVWVCVNPTTDATANIAVPAGGTMQYSRGIAISLAGVDQDAPAGDSDAADGSANPASSSLDIASAVGDLVVDFIAQSAQDARVMIAGSGQTNRANVVEGVIGPEGRLQASTEPGGASVTMSWANTSGNVSYRHFAVSMNAATGGGGEPVVSTKLIFGSQPGNITVGQTFGAFTVRAVDDDDALDESFDGDVTLALETGKGELEGTLTEAAVAGIAIFDDVHIDTLNVDAVIQATADGLTAANSDEFDVTAGEGGGTSGFPSSSRLGGLLQ